MRMPGPSRRRSLTWNAESWPRLHMMEMRRDFRYLYSVLCRCLRMGKDSGNEGASIFAGLQQDGVHSASKKHDRNGRHQFQRQMPVLSFPNSIAVQWKFYAEIKFSILSISPGWSTILWLSRLMLDDRRFEFSSHKFPIFAEQNQSSDSHLPIAQIERGRCKIYREKLLICNEEPKTALTWNSWFLHQCDSSDSCISELVFGITFRRVLKIFLGVFFINVCKRSSWRVRWQRDRL